MDRAKHELPAHHNPNEPADWPMSSPRSPHSPPLRPVSTSNIGHSDQMNNNETTWHSIPSATVAGKRALASRRRCTISNQTANQCHVDVKVISNVVLQRATQAKTKRENRMKEKCAEAIDDDARVLVVVVRVQIPLHAMVRRLAVHELCRGTRDAVVRTDAARRRHSFVIADDDLVVALLLEHDVRTTKTGSCSNKRLSAHTVH
jgi:hypothetical protein